MVALPSSAQAAGAAQCSPTARVFTVQRDGDLWLYEHGAPATGDFSWPAVRQIGWGWAGRTLAGPNSEVYNITDAGEVRRFRWNGTWWEQFGGRDYEVLPVTKSDWTTAKAPRNLITVDERGDFYKIVSGDLYRAARGDASLAWTKIGGGYGGYNYLVASGPGLLYGRTANGDLHRFRYQAESQKLYPADGVGTEWDNLWKIVGVGGGVLYGAQKNGDLYWNRDVAESAGDVDWADANGRVVGYDWGNDLDTVGSPDTCARVPQWGPFEPTVVGEPRHASTVVEIGGKLGVYHVGGGTLSEGSETTGGAFDFHTVTTRGPLVWGTVPVDVRGTKAIALPVTASGQYEYTDIDPGRGSQFGPTVPGWNRTTLTTVRVGDQLVAYAVDPDGSLWRRAGVPSVTTGLGSGPWQQIGVPGVYDARPAALALGDGSVLLAIRDTLGGFLHTMRDRNGVIEPGWQSGNIVQGTPAIVRETPTTVAVLARGTQGSLFRVLVDNSNKILSSTDLAPGLEVDGDPSAAVGPDGLVDVGVRTKDGGVAVARQTSVGGGYGPLTRVGAEAAYSDPTLFTRTDGRRLVLFRGSVGGHYLYTAGANGYTGGKIS
ncbi:tachylectin-related carbohydrate-binding protein [Actinosynnema sp. NPDC020468]|uniref:tachylectin-related carbohydrate-binding protein n=1 Tax=Actinosynnema sp. NPDC020468 TaxID=3154488 RepID=UPI003400113D